jgi:hypothetical protein
MKLSLQPVDISSEGAVSNPPGTVIDPIEYLRGQLAAMAYVSSTSAREVHILRLRNAFEQAGFVYKLRYSLSVLNIMREVQKLSDGYWFPTPLRIIPIGDEKGIIVGPASTQELQRHFCGVSRAGYARVLALSVLDGLDFPIQKLDDWLGLQVQDSMAWAEAQLTEAHRCLKLTISPAKVQYFDVKTARSKTGNITIPAWTDTPSSSMQLKGMFLCRERLGRDSFRYFFGKAEGRCVVAESSTLESSWAHLFREEILHNLPAGKLFRFYDEFKGRKTKELYAMLGLVLIQQMEDCTDEQAIKQFAFNLMWQYALNITDASDTASYVSLRTLWNLRDIVAQEGLDDALFENVTDALKKLFALDRRAVQKQGNHLQDGQLQASDTHVHRTVPCRER